jgi:hypothetical protein
MKSFKILGTNGDHDTCSLCGRTELRRVVWMAEVDADGSVGSPEPVGTSCAARLMKCTATKVDRMATDADLAREQAERNKVHQVGEVRSVKDWIVESVSGMGDCSTLTRANGLRSEIQKWAETAYPNLLINVRLAR